MTGPVDTAKIVPPADEQSQLVDPAPGSIAESAEEALKLFRSFLVALSSKVDGGSPNDELEKMLEEYGRLRIWAEQTGATLRERGSLDDTLHGDHSLQAAIASVFEQLHRQLRLATTMALKPTTTFEFLAPDLDSAESLTSDSEYSGSGQEDTTSTAARPPRISKQSLVAHHISDQIALLYHYSVLLRRPRLGGRYLRSGAGYEKPDIQYYEISHVQQKMKEWAPPKEEARSDDAPRPATESSSIDYLCLRLASANARRREQLRYWSLHPFVPDKSQQPVESSTADQANADIDVWSLPGASEAQSQRTHPSIHTTFSSVARSAIMETKTVAGPSRTVYSASIAGDEPTTAIKIPKIPDLAKNSPTFECPYCHMRLSSIQMQDRSVWKRHIFRDLRPYVCTYAACKNPDKLYATRREWMYHEMQMHLRQWTCSFCSSPFREKQALATHIQTHHSQICNPTQRHVAIETSEGPVDETRTEACQFCEQKHPLRRLMDHVAGHLEAISLFALPDRTGEDLPDEGSSGVLSSLGSEKDDLYYSLIQAESVAPPYPPDATDTGTSTNELPVAERSEPMVFTCDQCERVFDQIHKLNHHKRYHERSHECPYPGCGKRFGTKTHLERHINDKHLIMRKYYCAVAGCPYSKGQGKSIPRKDNWRRHMLNKHGMDPGVEIPPELIDEPEFET